MIYPDDIHMVNYSYVKHIITITAVLKIEKDNMLWFNQIKCQFMPATMQILGNILSDQGLEADPEKIDAILKFPKQANNR